MRFECYLRNDVNVVCIVSFHLHACQHVNSHRHKPTFVPSFCQQTIILVLPLFFGNSRKKRVNKKDSKRTSEMKKNNNQNGEDIKRTTTTTKIAPFTQTVAVRKTKATTICIVYTKYECLCFFLIYDCVFVVSSVQCFSVLIHILCLLGNIYQRSLCILFLYVCLFSFSPIRCVCLIKILLLHTN